MSGGLFGCRHRRLPDRLNGCAPECPQTQVCGHSSHRHSSHRHSRHRPPALPAVAMSRDRCTAASTRADQSDVRAAASERASRPLEAHRHRSLNSIATPTCGRRALHARDSRGCSGASDGTPAATRSHGRIRRRGARTVPSALPRAGTTRSPSVHGAQTACETTRPTRAPAARRRSRERAGGSTSPPTRAAGRRRPARRPRSCGRPYLVRPRVRASADDRGRRR